MRDQVLFESQRSKVINEYKAKGVAFEAKTKPYKSTRQLLFTVVDKFPGSPTMAHAVAKSGQELNWFDYKIGDSIPSGPSSTRVALESDTNLTNPRRTNGVEDFVIEGISASMRSARGVYPSAAYTGTDPDCIAAYLGNGVIFDPAALALPPQVHSPFNLENCMFEAIRGHVAVEFEWDRRRVEKIGTLDQIPEGAGKSYLRASGEPTTENRYRVPEGYVWRAAPAPDCEFIVRGKLPEPVVVPINFVGLLGSGTLTTTLTHLAIDISVRVHGISIVLPSKN